MALRGDAAVARLRPDGGVVKTVLQLRDGRAVLELPRLGGIIENVHVDICVFLTHRLVKAKQCGEQSAAAMALIDGQSEHLYLLIRQVHALIEILLSL